MKDLHAAVVLVNVSGYCKGVVGSTDVSEGCVLDLSAKEVGLLDELEREAHGYVPAKMTAEIRVSMSLASKFKLVRNLPMHEPSTRVICQECQNNPAFYR